MIYYQKLFLENYNIGFSNYLGFPTEVYKIDTLPTRTNIKNSTRAIKTLPWKFAYLPQSDRYRSFSRLVHSNDPRNINNVRMNLNIQSKVQKLFFRNI